MHDTRHVARCDAGVREHVPDAFDHADDAGRRAWSGPCRRATSPSASASTTSVNVPPTSTPTNQLASLARSRSFVGVRRGVVAGRACARDVTVAASRTVGARRVGARSCRSGGTEAAATRRAHHEAISGDELDADLPRAPAPRRVPSARSTSTTRVAGAAAVRARRRELDAVTAHGELGVGEQLDHRSRCRGRRATRPARRSRASRRERAHDERVLRLERLDLRDHRATTEEVAAGGVGPVDAVARRRCRRSRRRGSPTARRRRRCR